MNNVNLVGRLAKDPELRSVRDSDITTLIVATDRPKLQNCPSSGHLAQIAA
jgi:single-strand DNA-binding protein